MEVLIFPICWIAGWAVTTGTTLVGCEVWVFTEVPGVEVVGEGAIAGVVVFVVVVGFTFNEVGNAVILGLVAV